MKRSIQIMIMVMVLIVGSLGVGIPIEAQGENAWVLIDVVDYPEEESWERANEHISYNTDVTYSPSSFSAKQTYIGRTQGTKVNGEGVKLWGDLVFRQKLSIKTRKCPLQLI